MVQKTNGNLAKNGKEKRDQDIKDYYFRKGRDLQARFNLRFATVTLKFGDRGHGITDVEVVSHYKREDYNGTNGHSR